VTTRAPAAPWVFMRAAVTLTLAEAAALLEPPLTEAQLRAIIRALGWKPDGHRPSGPSGGRPAAAYDATRLLKLHEVLAPFNEVSLRYVQAVAMPGHSMAPPFAWR